MNNNFYTQEVRVVPRNGTGRKKRKVTTNEDDDDDDESDKEENEDLDS